MIAIGAIGIVIGIVIVIRIRIGGAAEVIKVVDAVGISTQTGAVHSSSGRLPGTQATTRASSKAAMTCDTTGATTFREMALTAMRRRTTIQGTATASCIDVTTARPMKTVIKPDTRATKT